MNAPAGETRKPLTVDLEIEFEGFSGKERYGDALLYPKGVLLRTRYLKPVGTPANFTVMGQEGSSPIGGHGQVVFSRWQDQGPRRPAGLGIRIDGWDGDSEARVARWFEVPSQFDLVDAQAVPAPAATGGGPASPAAAAIPEVLAEAPAAPSIQPPLAPPVEAPALPAVSAVQPPTEASVSASRWIADDVPASMPDLSLRFGKPAGARAAADEQARVAESREGVSAGAPAAAPSRPVWQPLADAPAPASKGFSEEPPQPPVGGAETIRIPRYSATTGSLPRAGAHVTRQEDSGGTPPSATSQEPFRPVWETAASAAETVKSAALPRLPSPGDDELPIGREGNVVWLPPAKPKITPWILAGVLAVVVAGGGYWLYLTRFAPQAAPATQENRRGPAIVTQAVEPAPAATAEPAPAEAGATGSGSAETTAPTPPALPAPTPPIPAAEPERRAASPAPARVVPAQPLSEPARRFGALDGVAWNVEGDDLVLRLRLDGTASARDLQQFRVAGSPPREVVKLRGCRALVARRFEVGEARLRSVRVGEQPGGEVHVVLDLGDSRVTVAPLTIDGATLVLRLRR